MKLELKIFPKRTVRLILVLLVVVGLVLAVVVSKSKKLSQKTSRITEPTPIASVKPYTSAFSKLLGDDEVVAINKYTSELVKITPTETTTISPGPVYTYSFSKPLIALITRDKPNDLTVIDTNTERSQTTTLDEYGPIISVAISPDLQNIYFLGKHAPVLGSSTLFRSAVDRINPQPLIQTSATNIESLANDLIILFSRADGPDLSTVDIVNTGSRKPLTTIKGNYYLASPAKNKVAIVSSTKIYIYDVIINKQSDVQIDDQVLVVWKDDKTLVLIKNLYPGISIADVDSDTHTLSTFVPVSNLNKLTLQSVAGVVDGVIVAFDTQGVIWKIPLP